jgi:hypothetical protein
VGRRSAEQTEGGIHDHRVGVVAVAGVVHAVSLVPDVFLQVPQRRHVGRAEGVVHRGADHEVLGEIHGVVAAASPVGKIGAVDPGELRLPFEQPLLGDGNDEKAVEQLVDDVEIGDAVDFGHQDVGVEARVLGAVDEIAEEAFDVGGMAGAADHENRVGIRRRPVAGGVADGAVVGDAGEADGFLGETHGQFLAHLPGHAERGVAARDDLAILRKLLREDPGQHVEDPVRHAGIVFGANRPVLEAHFGRGGDPVRLRVLAEAAVVADERADDGDDQQGQADGLEPALAGRVAHDVVLRKSSGTRSAPSSRWR